jgi:hypothetical protein
MKRILAILLSCFLATALFASCTIEESINPTSTASGSAAPETTGEMKSTSGVVSEASDATEATSSTSPETSAKTKAAGEGTLTKDILDIYSGGKYHLKYKMKTAAGDTAADTYIKGDKMATEMVIAGIATRTVISDGFAYLIMDAAKMVVKSAYDSANAAASGVADPSNMRFAGSGKEEFAGESLDYEQYDSNGVQTYYFVKDGGLKGIRTVNRGVTTDMEILSIDKKVPAGVFDIPADYTIMG